MSEQYIPDELDITWVTNVDALRPLHDEWRELAIRTGADFYLWPDWFAVWWKHFGHGCSLACIVVRKGGVLVAVLPFSLKTIWLGPLPVRTARLAGTDPHCIVIKLPVENNLTDEIVQESLTHLIKHKACDVVSFTPVSDLSDIGGCVRHVCQETSAVSLRDEAAGSHVVFELPASFDDFLKNLSRNRRGQFRRDVRRLSEQYQLQEKTLFPDGAGILDFVEFHNHQWQATGRGGHFCDWPGSAGFYQELANNSGSTGHLQLHRLTSENGKPLATLFSLVAGQICHSRLPARRIDPLAEKLSIGKVGLLLMIKQLIADGIQLIEAGAGEYNYKISVGGKNVPLNRMIVYPSTTSGRFRLSLLLAWANFLDLAYYRIWFKKLAPRLRKVTGGQPRPLWKSWIRTRF